MLTSFQANRHLAAIRKQAWLKRLTRLGYLAVATRVLCYCSLSYIILHDEAWAKARSFISLRKAATRCTASPVEQGAGLPSIRPARRPIKRDADQHRNEVKTVFTRQTRLTSLPVAAHVIRGR